MEDLILRAKRLFYAYWMRSGLKYDEALQNVIEQEIKEAEELEEATQTKIEVIKILIEWQKTGQRP